jgi:hypothetical protein
MALAADGTISLSGLSKPNSQRIRSSIWRPRCASICKRGCIGLPVSSHHHGSFMTFLSQRGAPHRSFRVTCAPSTRSGWCVSVPDVCHHTHVREICRFANSHEFSLTVLMLQERLDVTQNGLAGLDLSGEKTFNTLAQKLVPKSRSLSMRACMVFLKSRVNGMAMPPWLAGAPRFGKTIPCCVRQGGYHACDPPVATGLRQL